MRGSVHHLDAVLGFMGYQGVREDLRCFDWKLTSALGGFVSIGLKKAQGDGRGRVHDRYAPGLHHVAWRANSRSDVDRLHGLLLEMGATVLDALSIL